MYVRYCCDVHISNAHYTLPHLVSNWILYNLNSISQHIIFGWSINNGRV